MIDPESQITPWSIRLHAKVDIPEVEMGKKRMVQDVTSINNVNNGQDGNPSKSKMETELLVIVQSEYPGFAIPVQRFNAICESWTSQESLWLGVFSLMPRILWLVLAPPGGWNTELGCIFSSAWQAPCWVDK